MANFMAEKCSVWKLLVKTCLVIAFCQVLAFDLCFDLCVGDFASSRSKIVCPDFASQNLSPPAKDSLAVSRLRRSILALRVRYSRSALVASVSGTSVNRVFDKD